MDPITATVVWGVIWFALIWALPIIGQLSGVVVGVLIDDDAGVIVALVGVIIGLIGSVFAIIQVILHIIALVQLLT